MNAFSTARVALPGAATACVVMLFGGLGAGVAIGGVMPLPYGPLGPIAAYVHAEPVAIRVIATATFASSVPLAVYAAAAAARLRTLGAGVAAAIALTGGALAAGALGLTGLLGWTLSRPDVAADPALVRALYLLVFLVGSPGHLTALGLLIAAIAAPARGLLPRPLAWAGIGIAALAEATTLVLIWPQLGVALPITRVLALVWLVAAGALLARADLDPV
jgi:hypothetical protein